MVREQLLRTLLQVVLEEGGGAPAPWSCSRATAASRSRRRPAPRRRRPPPAAGRGARLPDSLLRYVQRTQERVLLDDAAADAGRFSGDAYLARARPRSVLCLPIRRQAEVVALLYLENDLVPGAFTPERLLALELLAAQAAISLENALLLEREHAGRVEAEAAERRAVLLAEATAVMTSTLDYEGVFSALTRAVRALVRRLGDHRSPSRGTRRVRLAGAHRDPEKEPLLRELAERYPAAPARARRRPTVLDERHAAAPLRHQRRGACAALPSTSITPS